MRDELLESMVPTALRAGLAVSFASICWTALSSTASIGIGLSAGSLVLVSFGLTGLLDAFGSVALVVHFRHALRHESFSERHEAIALRIITVGLVVVAIFSGADSIVRLVEHDVSRSAPAGLALAAASTLVLAALSVRKRRVAPKIPSRALLADSMLSATGAALALFTVIGTALLSLYGWWWADPVSALAIGLGALWIAWLMAHSSS